METWNNVPPEEKLAWGEGPWQSEPDKAQWIDEATGLDCLIVRGPLGALCGYVGVPEGHPCHGKSYSSVPDSIHEAAHCGLTFASGCSHSEDPAKGICHIPAPGRSDAVWWLGFDCAHAWDLKPEMTRRDAQRGWLPMGDERYRDFEYVKRTCTELAAAAALVTKEA